MGIWLKCIKHRKKHNRSSLFTESKFFTYSHAKVYLGAEGKAITIDGNLELLMSFSIRDGILVKFKQNQPPRILFDYIDGAYYVNDDFGNKYDQLVQGLLSLQNSQNDIESIYYQIERLVFDFISKNFESFKSKKE